MAGTEETEVKDVERVEVTPTTDDELVEGDTEDTDQDSSPENEGDEEESEESDDSKKPDELVRTTETAPEAATPQETAEGAGDDVELKEVPGETPRERALRLELTRVKRAGRRDRVDELVQAPRTASKPTELGPEEKAVIGKYKPEEIQALKEVFPVLAKEMGFVRKDELESNTFVEKSQEVLDTFLEKHPEYLPENDTDNTLWSAFKTEFSLYKAPASPKEYQRILDKVHRDVFGIKPSKVALTTVNAQREKAKNASHAGASSAAPTPRAKPATASPSGLRLDMLKGFSDDDKSDIFGDE